MSAGSFKNVIYKLFVYQSYILNVYVWTGFGIKHPTRVDMPQNPTNQPYIKNKYTL